MNQTSDLEGLSEDWWVSLLIRQNTIITTQELLFHFLRKYQSNFQYISVHLEAL